MHQPHLRHADGTSKDTISFKSSISAWWRAAYSENSARFRFSFASILHKEQRFEGSVIPAENVCLQHSQDALRTALKGDLNLREDGMAFCEDSRPKKARLVFSARGLGVTELAELLAGKEGLPREAEAVSLETDGATTEELLLGAGGVELLGSEKGAAEKGAEESEEEVGVDDEKEDKLRGGKCSDEAWEIIVPSRTVKISALAL
jgi:hypothetical protein